MSKNSFIGLVKVGMANIRDYYLNNNQLTLPLFVN